MNVLIHKRLIKRMPKSYNQYIPKDSFRLHVYKKFYSLFPKHQKIAINIERSIFNWSIKKLGMANKILDTLFHFIYTNKSVVIYRNLNINSSLKNNTLYPKVISGEINPVDLVDFGPDKMFPERHAALLQQFHTEIIITGQSEVLDYEGLIKCFKCGSFRVSYYELQQRSSDEPTSKICHCTSCKHNFKVF